VIEALWFGEPDRHGGPAPRSAAFRLRSRLPASAVCLVANGVRETLQRMLGWNADVRAGEPTVPDAAAKALLFDRALVYRVGGSLTDVFIVLRSRDALRLAGLAFGEGEPAARDRLSAIEVAALDRVAAGLAAQCGALCGTVGAVRRERSDRNVRACTTYFDVRGGEPTLAIGFALAREPIAPPGPGLTIERLLDVGLRATVELARGRIDLERLGTLREGDLLELETGLDEPGALVVAGVPMAGVACGELGGRRAAALQ
jgi:hypothetical protein